MTGTVLSTPGHSSLSPTLDTFSRRMRPPDLVIKANMDDRQSLRAAEKPLRSGKRESRLGFRSLFMRHKPVTEMEPLKSPRSVTAGNSNLIPQTLSIPNFGGIGVHSEIHLPPLSEDDHPVANRPSTAVLKSPARSTFAPPSSPPTKRRGSLATWEPVPLFQAWPQALRSATLPACLQADHLLKLHNRKESNTHVNHPDIVDDKGMFAEMAKKKHRRNSSSFKLDWTTKIYILVTAGYLLQYAAEGSHDRLPEKVVHLCKYSAAFASDVIPGRHWVLQVSSVFDEGTAASHDTRSLLGKFGLREKEKRQASDILMVFEAAGDMESWIALLRKEIESLGGKRPVTETGAPMPEGLRHQPSLHTISPITTRTPVVRDPNRFGRRPSVPDMRTRWDASAPTIDGLGLQFDPTTFGDWLPEPPFDDNSATNSFVSSDSRQLDGLRDSSHRYSFMSNARTIVTSDSSACNSPIRDSFGSGSQGSQGSNSPSDDATAVADDTLAPKVRLRHNASDIEDRRKSYRTSNIFLDPTTSCVSHRAVETPNFSLPNATARRRAASQSSTDNVSPMSYDNSNRPPRRPRRPPPSALGFTRPLSIVADSPSPSKASSPRIPFDASCVLSEWPVEDLRAEYDLSSDTSSRGSMGTSFRVSVHNSPRKYASMTALPPTRLSLDDKAEAARSASPEKRKRPSLQAIATALPRSTSSMGDSDAVSPRSRSPIQREMAAQKRASLYSLTGSTRSSRHVTVSMSVHQTDELTRGRGVSPQPPPRSPYRRSLMSPGHARNGSGSSAKSFLSNRRSLPQMPQLQREANQALLMVPCAAGPPPAPPPNKALPPVPTGKKKTRSASIPPKMGQRMVGSVDGGVF